MQVNYNDIEVWIAACAENNAKWQAASDTFDAFAYERLIEALVSFANAMGEMFPARSTLMVRRLKRLRANTST